MRDAGVPPAGIPKTGSGERITSPLGRLGRQLPGHEVFTAQRAQTGLHSRPVRPPSELAGGAKPNAKTGWQIKLLDLGPLRVKSLGGLPRP